MEEKSVVGLGRARSPYNLPGRTIQPLRHGGTRFIESSLGSGSEPVRAGGIGGIPFSGGKPGIPGDGGEGGGRVMVEINHAVENTRGVNKREFLNSPLELMVRPLLGFAIKDANCFVQTSHVRDPFAGGASLYSIAQLAGAGSEREESVASWLHKICIANAGRDC